MTETGTSVQETPQNVDVAQQAEANKAELDRLMNINLNNGVVPAEEVVNEVVPQDVPREVGAEVPLTFEVIKEKFGYENPDAAIKEIEELRAFKATPPPAEPQKFENEKSEQVYKAIQAGKIKEVYEALAQQDRLDTFTSAEVNKDNAAEIIKLAMEVKYKSQDLSKAEIEYKFNKQYGIPREPVIGDSELEEDFADRQAAWKEQVADIEMNKIIDAKLAKPELELAKTKIVFPETQQSVDDGYLQYKKSLEDQPQIEAAMKEIYKGFTPKSLETKIRFTDEPNKVDFEFQHEPDVKAFDAAKEMALNSNKFLDLFKLPNGEFDNLKYLDALYFAANKEKILTEAINQGKNATIKSFLPDNSGGGTQRQFPQGQELSELDKQMQLSGIKRA